MASHFRDTFRQTFYLSRLSSTSSRGDEEHGEPQPYACRGEKGPRLVKDATGTQVVSSGRLFTEVKVELADLLYPPGADQDDYTKSVRPIVVNEQVDLEGIVDHYEVSY